MEKRFLCTVCGKCCTGLLPLTLADAVRHAGRFPLALMWTPVRKASRAHAVTVRLGVEVRLPDKTRLAVRVGAVSYLPPTMACPELAGDGRCAIHADKPLRCRTMPFFPYLDEDRQAEHLIPRPGWDCDTSAAAPVVYRDRKVVDRADFDAERAALLREAPIVRAYAQAVLSKVPHAMADLARASSAKHGGGYVVRSFASILPYLAGVDRGDFARRQAPVLNAYAAATADDPAAANHHRHYVNNAREMARLIAESGAG